MIRRSIGRKVKRFAVFMTAAVVVAFGALAGCSSGSEDKAVGGMNGADAKMEATEQAASSTAADMAVGSEEPKESESGSAANGGGGATEQTGQTSAGFDANAQNTENGEQDALNRKIVYRANITMQVEDYAKAQTALQNLIHLSDGYMLQFSDQKTGSELGGSFTIKIPASGFTGFLAQLEKIEHLDYQSSVKGTDVTEEFVDLESRLKARQVVEARLLSFMEKATRADDLLKFSQQLGEVQTEIERIKGRMRYLNQNVAYSTIEIRLYQTVEPGPSAKKKETAFGKRLSDALTGSTELLYQTVQGLIVVIAALLPFAAVLAVVGVPVYYVVRKRQQRSEASSGSAPPALTRTEAAKQPAEKAGQDEDSPNS
jgi:hypothetical protein